MVKNNYKRISVENQLIKMHRFISCSDTGSMSENSSTDMHNKLLQMQTDVENLVETANKLIADKENKDTTFSVRIYKTNNHNKII